MLTKALATEPGIEFDFFLAEKLRMTVAELRARMSNDEHVHWRMYYARRAQELELQQSKG
jgi:hypothetical protein